MDIGPGTVFGGLRIEGVAGRGGMGVVYRATQLALNRTVAVKVVAPELADDPEFRERFKREAELAASIDHPNVVPVYHAGEEDGRLFVTMRYVQGTDLRRLLQSNGPLAPPAAVEIIAQVSSALDAAHAHGVAHRDVKPANILIAGGEHVRAYLTDFGLTKHLAATGGLTRTGAVLGTVDYIAPEQLEGRPVDGRVDVYALGCVLFEALTGQVPFPRDTDAAKMWAHMGAPPPPLRELAPHLPAQLEEVLRRAMAKNPEERYGSAGEFGRAALIAVGAAAATPLPAAGATAPVLTQGPPPPVLGGVGVPGSSNPSVPPPGSSSPPTPPPTPFHPSVHAPGRGHVPGFPDPAAPRPRYVTSPAGGYPPRPPAPPRRRRTVPIVLGVLLVAGLVTGVLVYAGRGPDTPPPQPAGPKVAGHVVGTPVKTGDVPGDIVSSGGFVWVANTGSRTVSKVDLRTGSSNEISVGGSASALAADGTTVWVRTGDTSVVWIDAATGQVSSAISTGSTTFNSMTAGGGYVWFAHYDQNTVSRLDARTLRVENPVAVGVNPRWMAYDNGAVFVVNEGDGTVSRIDAATGQVVGQALAVPGAGGGIVVHERILYLGTGDTITPVDQASNAIGRPTRFQGGAAYFAVGAGSVWLNYPTENVIRRYDLESGLQRDEPIRGLGKDVGALVFLDGELLVANNQTAVLTRIQPSS